MLDKLFKGMLLASAIFLLLALVFVLGRFYGFQTAREGLKPEVDTLFITDTFFAEKPVPVEVRVPGKTIYVPITDSTIVTKHDTTFVELPIEEKVYQDSTYRAVISGYKPSLDSIEVYNKTTIITKTVTVPPSKWNFSITAGPALIVDIKGRPSFGAGVMAGISYNF